MYQFKIREYIVIIFLASLGFLNAQTLSGQYVIKNLSINTKYSDFGTTFYGDNHVVFSSPKNEKSLVKTVWKPNKQRYLDLYIGSIDTSGEIVYKQQLLGEINSKFHQAKVEFTNDLRTIYFTGNNSKSTIHLQLFKASIAADGTWINIELLPFNSDQYSTGHPALSADNKKLYFISNRPGTLGKTDIYVVDIHEDGSYGDPINLGKGINTKDKEMFPSVSDDNILYFSSEGHSSTGGLDVFASKISADFYSKPLNLGKPINSTKDDFAYIINSENTKGYFSSNRDEGRGDDDIYSFESTIPINIECIQLVEGVLKDQNSKEVIADSTINLIGKDGNDLEKVMTDDNGKFSFEIECGTSYTIKGSKEGYQGDEKQITSTNSFNDQKIIASLNLVPDVIEIKEIEIDINSVYFDLNKVDIRYDAAIELDKVVKLMKENPTIIVESRSHTDSRGNDLYNLKLSDRRAKSTVNYIISMGIDSSRISGKGFGETRSLNTCHSNQPCTEDEHLINRRTKFFIVSNK